MLSNDATNVMPDFRQEAWVKTVSDLDGVSIDMASAFMLTLTSASLGM